MPVEIYTPTHIQLLSRDRGSRELHADACLVMACIVMAYIVMAYAVMAYVVMACIVVVYIGLTKVRKLHGRCRACRLSRGFPRSAEKEAEGGRLARHSTIQRTGRSHRLAMRGWTRAVCSGGLVVGVKPVALNLRVGLRSNARGVSE